MAMSVIAVKVTFFLKKVWLWIKVNWKISLAALVALVLYFTVKQRENRLRETISYLMESHQQEADGIRSIHDKQLKDIEKANERLTDSMQQIEAKYEEKKIQMDKKTKKRIEQIIRENGDDPGYIARELATLTGFQIYVKE